MKVTCEYCGSYVEADENLKCPFCGATLGGAVATEQARIEEQAEIERQHEAEEAAQEAKENHISEIIGGVASVASAFATSKAAANAQTTASTVPSMAPAPDSRSCPPKRPMREGGGRPSHDMPKRPRDGHMSADERHSSAHTGRMAPQDGRMGERASNRPSNRGMPAQRSSKPPHDR